MPANDHGHRASPARVERGFTLVELMITIAVAAIVMAYAVPNMRNFMQRDRVAAQSNNLVADLQFARGQAVSTHTYVSICPTATAGGTTCDTTDGNYDQGWMIFTTSSPGTAYSGVASSLLKVGNAPTTTSVTSTAAGILTYDPLGQLWAGGSVAPTAFDICALATDGSSENTASVPGALLNVSMSGRVAAGTMATGAGCN